LPRVEGRVEIDQIHRLILHMEPKDLEIVTVIELILFSSHRIGMRLPRPGGPSSRVPLWAGHSGDFPTPRRGGNSSGERSPRVSPWAILLPSLREEMPISRTGGNASALILPIPVQSHDVGGCSRRPYRAGGSEWVAYPGLRCAPSMGYSLALPPGGGRRLSSL